MQTRMNNGREIMRKRLKIWGYHLLYRCFDKYHLAIAIGLLFAGIIGVQCVVAGKLNCECVVFFGVGVVMISFTLIKVKHHGILLTYPSGNNLTAVTMRGISPAKLRIYTDHEISQTFLNDFKVLLRRKCIRSDIIINTHALYSQGVLNVLYEMYDPEKKVPKITRDTSNEQFMCKNEIIRVRMVGKHNNYMAVIKISLTADQSQIDRYLQRKYQYYEIRIPMSLID